MKFVLFSAEHTGTNFVNEFLTGLGLCSAGQLPKPASGFEESGNGFNAGSLDFVQIHSTPWRAYEAWGKTLPDVFDKAIIPLRNPLLAYQTKRHIFEKSAPEFVHKEFIAEWECLIDLSSRFKKVCFVNLETEDRIGTLIRVCEFVGKDNNSFVEGYGDNWMAVNKHDYQPQEFDISDLDFAVEWYKCQILQYK